MKSNLIIDIFDIFGVGFSFSINYKKRISSIFGDVLTLLIIVITIILFFSLGEDFLKSKNPLTSTSLFQRNEFSLVNLTEDYSTIVISFTRKIQQLGLPPSVNINGEFLYYGFNHYNITFKESTNSTNTNGKGYKNLTCSKEFLAKYNFNEGNYYCLNINEQPELLGDENLKTRIIDHFYISICEDNCPYSVCSDYDLCSSFEKLDEFFLKYQSDSIFKIYYPTHFYDPNNHDNPSQIIYKETSFPFDHNLQRFDFLYFRETIVEDDSGWLFSNKKNTSYWTVEELDNYVKYRTNDILKTTEISSSIYSLKILQSKNVVYHSRRYMKLTELITYIFCYIRIIMSIVSFAFSILINPIIHQFELINLFFGKCSSQKTIDTDFVRNINFTTSKPTLLQNSTLKKINKKINESQNSQNLNLNQVSIQKNALETSGLALNGTIHDKKSSVIKKKKISKKDYLCYKINNVFKSKSSSKYKEFLLIDDLLSYNYDLMRYTEMIYDIQIIKQCIFPKECLVIANNHKKYNINNVDESEKLFGFKHYSYNYKNDINESITLLKANYPNMVKDHNYFISLIQE